MANAYEESLQRISVPAGSDLSSHQYKFVVVNASGQLALATTDSKADGVLQDKPAAAGRAGSMAISGVSKVRASGTVTAGDDIAVASGSGKTAATGDVVVGRALTGAATGNIFACLISRSYEPLA